MSYADFDRHFSLPDTDMTDVSKALPYSLISVYGRIDGEYATLFVDSWFQMSSIHHTVDGYIFNGNDANNDQELTRYHEDTLLDFLQYVNPEENDIQRYKALLPGLHIATRRWADEYYNSLESHDELVAQREAHGEVFSNIEAYRGLKTHLEKTPSVKEENRVYLVRRTIGFLGMLGLYRGIDEKFITNS